MIENDKSFRVFLTESSYPDDFYSQRLDGNAAHALLNILEAESRLRMVLDLARFRAALREARRDGFNVLHLSCHGGEHGVALANNYQPNWTEFAKFFQEADFAPQALVMSSCCGAASGIGDAFAKIAKRPEIIIGLKDERPFGEHAVSWALLYHQFLADGVTKQSSQTALRQIGAVVGGTFLYRRWHSDKYRTFPKSGTRYKIQEDES